jgi:hypothetical protein
LGEGGEGVEGGEGFEGTFPKLEKRKYEQIFKFGFYYSFILIPQLA